MASTMHCICTFLLFLSVQIYAQSNVCPDEGSVYLTHQNCSHFIACNIGQGRIHQCPGGLYFNPEDQSCDYPENVPECVGGTRPSQCPGVGSTTLPHQICSLLILCSDGLGEIYQCPSGLYFNHEGGFCDYPRNVPECVGGTRPPDCPAENDSYLPHGNCTNFILCRNGRRTILPCAVELYFNPELEICDWPHNVANCVGGIRPPECPREGTIRLPHKNCSLYTQCDNGHRGIYQCPPNLHFNPALQACDSPQNVPECVAGTRPPA